MKNKELEILLNKANEDLSLIPEQLEDIEEYKRKIDSIIQLKKQEFEKNLSQNNVDYLKKIFSSKEAKFYYDNFVDKKNHVFNPINSTSVEYFQLIHPFITEKDKENWKRISLYRHTRTEIASFSQKSFKQNTDKFLWILKNNKDDFNHFFLKLLKQFWGSIYMDLNIHKELNDFILSKASDDEKKKMIISSIQFPPGGDQNFFKEFINNKFFNKEWFLDNSFCSFLMESALVSGNVSVFTMFLNKGIEIKEENSLYASLVTVLGKNRNDNLSTILNYIKENKDFYTGKHVIFRAALHHMLNSYADTGRKEVLEEIITMYDKEKLSELFPILEKKISKETGSSQEKAVALLEKIQKLSFTYKLEEDLPINSFSKSMKI